MAEGSDADEDFAPMHLCEDLVCCVICYEPFSASRTPKALSCLHTFCAQCLKRTIQAHLKIVISDVTVPPDKRKPPKDFPCPVCKESIAIPRNGVAGFRDDFRVQKIKDAFAKSCEIMVQKGWSSPRSGSRSDLFEAEASSDKESCGVCRMALDSEGGTDRYCLECFKRLCPRCLDIHLNTPITADHKIVELPHHVTGSSIPTSTTCEVHPAEPLRYYCRTCQQPVCVACTMATGSHEGHDVSRLLSEVTKVKVEASGVVDSCKSRLADMKRRLEEIDAVESELQTKEQSVRRAILSKTMDDIFRARHRQTRMERDLESLCRQKNDKLGQVKSNLKDSVSDIESRCTFLEDLLSHGQDLQIMLVAGNLLEAAGESVTSRGDDDDVIIPGEFTKLGRYDSLLEELDGIGKADEDNLSPNAVLAEIRSVVSEIRDLSANQLAGNTPHNGTSQSSPPPTATATATATASESAGAAEEEGVRKRELKRLSVSEVKDSIVIGQRGDKAGEFCFPSGVTFLLDGGFVVADMHNHRIQIFAADGSFRSQFTHGSLKPCDVALTRDGLLAVTDCTTGDSNVKLFTQDGVLKSRVGKGLLKYPFSIVIDSKDRYVVCDTSTNCINILRHQGDLYKRFSTKTKFAFYIAVGRRDEILLSDWFNHCVKVFDDNGNVLRRIGSRGSQDGELMIPLGLCTDPDGDVMVLDCKSGRVSKFDADGRFLKHVIQQADYPGIRYSRAIAVAKDNSRLLVTSGDNRGHAPNEIRIFKVK